jgi:TRAP-type C4-dicarboxylate transport system permease small subunit
MRVDLAALSRILSVVNKAALWISGIGLVLMTGFIAWQVFGRYVLNESPSWTEPASLLLMSWFILLGSAVGVREGNHLGFEIALHYATPGLRQAMLIVTEVLVIGFGGAMAWYGTELAVGTWSAAMPGLPIPQGMDYVPLVGGGVLIALFSLEKLVRLLLAEAVPLVRADEPHLVVVKE